MTISINVNGLTLVHQYSDGVATATTPDVCKNASGVPVPFPNVAKSANLAKGSKTVKADGGHMAANYGSEFASSTGDEAGTGEGVTSGTHAKEATWLSFSFDVKIEGKSACRLTDKMLMNHGNTVCMSGELQGSLPQQLAKKLEKCEEGKEQKKKADEANGGPVDIQVEPMGDFDGKANPDAGYVKINEHSDPCTQMETLFFELGNIKRQAEFDAAAGNLMTATREDYIKGFERVEYANVKDTLEAIDKCKDAWGCQNHTFDFDAFRPARDFDDYYNRFLADEHKEWFGVDWDAVHNP